MQDISYQITILKETIFDLREYLYSDICRQCGEVAIRLEKCILDLEELLKKI